MQECKKGLGKHGNMKSNQKKDRQDETECDQFVKKCKTGDGLKSHIQWKRRRGKEDS